jgi:hypothetical protein
MKVYISIPCCDQKVFYKCSESLFKLIKEFEDNEIEYSINYSYGSLISRIRNNEVHKFLKTNNCDYLLFIDSDVYGFEDYIVKILKDMKNKDMKVCGVSYPLKQFDNNLLCYNINHQLPLFETATRFNINLLDPNLKLNLENIKNDYLKVKHLPTGCLLIQKNVFFLLGLDNKIKSYMENNHRIWNYFDCRVYDDKYLSEDYSFCQYCLDAGIDNYCYVKGNINHIGYFDYNGNLEECIKKYYKISNV